MPAGRLLMQPIPGQIKTLCEKICFNDDKAAFTELFRLEYSRLYHCSMQYVRSHEAAEEVVNDVFVKLWKYRQSLHTIHHPENYLFIAVRNQSLNYAKKFSTLHISPADESGISALVAKGDPQHDLEWKELQFKLQQAVAQLPAQCGIVFRMVREEGLKPREVAAMLNISIRTVETQLYRAMKRIGLACSDQLTKKKKNRSGFPDFLLFLIFLGSCTYFLPLHCLYR